MYGGTGSRSHAELLEDVSNVDLYRGFADVKSLSDLTVREAQRDES
jgi:hypothetical protein